jgi:glucose/arabinose dehydrogenase
MGLMQFLNHPTKSAIRSIWLILPFFALMLSACAELPTASGISTSMQPEPQKNISPTIFVSGKTLTVTSLPTQTGVTQIPDPAKIHWVVAYSGFEKPVDLISPPGDPAKIVVLEQQGVIRLIQRGMTSLQPILDIRDRVGSNGSEQGLLGIAFHPQYAKNRYFYVNYTGLNGNTVIARFTVAQNGETADPQSEKKILQVGQPFANHNGGGLAFGPDGYLYIGLGDGGSQGDPQNNAQNLNSLLGKLLRIDVNQPEGYAIPADNPFARGGGNPEIWAYGLRNPWRFSFDARSGDLYIADVGQDLWEEVDFLPAGAAGGANFGWNLMEGNHPYRNQIDLPSNLIYPITEYDHNSGCSIIGGFVYRGQSLPAWQGVYLFGDYCRGTVWGLLKTSVGVEVKQLSMISGTISSFGMDGSGEIYVLDHQHGDVYKLVPRQ